MDDQLDLITDPAAFEASFPLPAEYSAAYTLAGRRAFVDAFSTARNAAEAAYYAHADLNTAPRASAAEHFWPQL